MMNKMSYGLTVLVIIFGPIQVSQVILRKLMQLDKLLKIRLKNGLMKTKK